MLQLYGNESQRRHSIRDASAIGEARRDSQRLASRVNLDEASSSRLGVIVTELASNVSKHGGGGELLLQAIPTATGSAVEVIAIDRGPGMSNVNQCLEDGYSSRGTPGTGLGAVKRLAAEFDIYSTRRHGTVVMARIGGHCECRLGAICTPKEGETECGDSWRLATNRGQLTALMVIDGLGHGPCAAQAAHAAAGSFASQPFENPARQIERAHQALGGTRGAAVACAAWNSTPSLKYAGIGNICGRLVGEAGNHGLVSHSGTVGFQVRRVQEFDYPFASGALLIMHSDGLGTRWDLDDYAGLRYRHPAIIAATLYRDHARARDDATVIVTTA